MDGHNDAVLEVLQGLKESTVEQNNLKKCKRKSDNYDNTNYLKVITENSTPFKKTNHSYNDIPLPNSNNSSKMNLTERTRSGSLKN